MTMPTAERTEDQAQLLGVNTLRALALDAIAKAKEGHPGAPLGMAPMAYVLWTKTMRFNPRNPNWSNRDRFVLSAGHASMLLYGALHLSGYDLPLEQIKQFRQWGSSTPGHPEFGHTPGVETTSGPLGQGFANAVGMALTQAHLAARYNQPNLPIFDSFTYCICSDGDLQEGISHETASLAGHLGLGKLVVLYDDNDIQLDGPTDWAFSENTTRRFEAYGWHVQLLEHGDTDLDGLEVAIHLAQADPRPSLIRVRTTIGFGLPKQGTAEVHGKAPSLEDVIHAKQRYGLRDFEPFAIDPNGAKPWLEAGDRGAVLEGQWNTLFAEYAERFPALAAELLEMFAGKLPANAFADLPKYEPGSKPVRTRDASGHCINALAPNIPALLGGSADLSGSNMTVFKGSSAMKHGSLEGRNINFGVREFAMAAIANGMTLSGLRPYVATFFTFSDYMKNAIRMAALMNLPVIYIFTHDSIGVGTDGPTHQPVEHLAALRAIPNLRTIRPADANETASAWKLALERTDGPTALILSRQDLRVLESNPEGVARGGYVIADSDGTPDVILIATGSEVGLALDAKHELEGRGHQARVVSLPDWNAFDSQPLEYRESVLPSMVTNRVGIEAGASLGWHKYVGARGALVTLDRFGASAPDAVVFEQLGFTVSYVVNAAVKQINA
jgi:transketolase